MKDENIRTNETWRTKKYIFQRKKKETDKEEKDKERKEEKQGKQNTHQRFKMTFTSIKSTSDSVRL